MVITVVCVASEAGQSVTVEAQEVIVMRLVVETVLVTWTQLSQFVLPRKGEYKQLTSCSVVLEAAAASEVVPFN